MLGTAPPVRGFLAEVIMRLMDETGAEDREGSLKEEERKALPRPKRALVSVLLAEMLSTLAISESNSSVAYPSLPLGPLRDLGSSCWYWLSLARLQPRECP